MEKTCSRCNALFNCQQETRGCWCEVLTLTTETLQHLEANYDNCLCPSCLAAFKSGALPGLA